MKVTISPRPLRGTIPIIASKSEAHRLLIAAALSGESETLLVNATNEDIDATARCLLAIGSRVERTADGFRILPGAPPSGAVDCGESGSTLRFLLPVFGTYGRTVALQLSGRLPMRPLSPLWEELTSHGMTLSWENENTLLASGQLQSGAYTLPGNISSQFISGLLFALPLLSGDSTLRLTETIESEQYIKMTEDALSRFGIELAFKNNTYYIPGGQVAKKCAGEALRANGDWSNAAFWLSAGALSESVAVEGLSIDSLQGDKEIAALLSRFGAHVASAENGICAAGAPLSGIEIDASQIPDLVPILAVVAAGAKGTTRIRGAARLRLKESDRLASVCAMLRGVGAHAEETEDGLIIYGGKTLSGGTVQSFGDHRIAMSAAILSSICHGTVTIEGAEAVNKSYPQFWAHFASLGGQPERSEL